ncbi:Transposase, Mutator family [Lacipirellula limnantheis]|uniref:Transposase, Mutator family n=1 Tax=Lacipirellula limnantheis TaxID=2528024 RepID=A0A517TVW6_9BACT|nr:Transposase, Mutator family [Lacipirellula limnantheis]
MDREHWFRTWTSNPLERFMREIGRRTRVVGAFPDGNSALILAAARLRQVAGTKWGTRKYLVTGTNAPWNSTSRPAAAGRRATSGS